MHILASIASDSTDPSWQGIVALAILCLFSLGCIWLINRS